MAGFVHQRHAASGFDGRRQALRTFHVKQYRPARYAAQHILSKQDHLAVRVNVGTVFGDNAQAVAIAIKSQAQLGVAVGQCIDQIVQVLRLARVRVVVREMSIDLAEQLNHLAAKRSKQSWRRGSRDAVARVNDDFHGTGKFNVRRDARQVGWQHIHAFHAAARLQVPAFSFHHVAQGLNLITINRAATQHHFEAVVIFRVVAAGHLDTAFAQRVGRKIQDRRGHHACIDHLDACSDQTANQRCHQRWPAQTPIAPDGNRFFAFSQSRAAERFAQSFCHGFVDGGRHDAANVVGFENGGCHLHRGGILRNAIKLRQL